MDRAYSLIEVKSLDESKRTFSGWATTPETDRVNDTIDPLGASFKNPLVLLHQHNADEPIGSVTFRKPTKAGIQFDAEIPVIKEPGPLKDRVDTAWGEVKNKLIRAVSIGFRPTKYAYKEDGGIDFQEVEIFELSIVSVPANAGALITDVKALKKFDTGAPAATGQTERRSNATPPASGKKFNPYRPKEGHPEMKNIGTLIADLEVKRKAKLDEASAIQSKAMDESRTKDADEQSKFDALKAEVETIDKELTDLRFMESSTVAPTARQVEKSNEGRETRVTVTATARKKLDPGIAFARLAKVKAVSRMDIIPAATVAEKMYGKDSEVYAITKANEVAPGDNLSGNWAADLVSSEGAAAADFAEYLRPATIIGKFGQNGIPALRSVPFRKPLVIQTGGGSGYWVGEAKPKPMTAFDFDRSTLDPLKCATIAVLSMENIRDSSPSSDAIVRDELRRVLVSLQDVAFIDPTNSGSANVKPASVLNGASAIAATSFTDENDVILDVRSLLQKFIDANNPASQAVLIMQEGTGLSAGLILNALGQRAFPGLGMRGGVLLDIPTITSENVPDGIVGIVNAADIFIGDDGDVTVDMSTEASLEMKSVPTQDPTAPGTGASLVSLWQNNLVGFRAERTVNWKRRRTTAAAYLTGVAWGGAVNIS